MKHRVVSLQCFDNRKAIRSACSAFSLQKLVATIRISSKNKLVKGQMKLKVAVVGPIKDL